MRSLFGRYRDRTLFVLCAAAACTLLGLDDAASAGAARRLAISLYAPIQALVRGANELVEVRSENRKLRRLVATLNLERQRLLQFRDQVDDLRRVAGFASERFPALLPCAVVGRSADRFQNAVQLGCGGLDSVRAEMPVVAYAGLVGRVREVSGQRALVETLASPGTAVSTLDQRSGVVGVLRWIRANQFHLDRVDAVEDVLVGDPLVTAGLGGVYPAGIPIGVVSRVETSLDGLFKQIEVRSHVDFAGLRDVFVVRDLVAWAEASVYSQEERRLLESLTLHEGAALPDAAPPPGRTP